MQIKRYRERAGYKQKELADVLCVSQQTIAKWETNAAYPAASRLPDIAKALHCTVGDLYKEDDNGNED